MNYRISIYAEQMFIFNMIYAILRGSIMMDGNLTSS